MQASYDSVRGAKVAHWTHRVLPGRVFIDCNRHEENDSFTIVCRRIAPTTMASQACFAQTSASEEMVLPLVKIDHSPQPKRNRNKQNDGRSKRRWRRTPYCTRSPSLEGFITSRCDLSYIEMEVAAGLEPAKTGFADRRLDHFGIATKPCKTCTKPICAQVIHKTVPKMPPQRPMYP